MVRECGDLVDGVGLEGYMRVSAFGGCGEAVDEVMCVLEVGGICLSGPRGAAEEALDTVAGRLLQKMGCGGLEFGTEVGGGLGCLVIEVDVYTEEFARVEGLSTFGFVEHPVVVSEVLCNVMETGCSAAVGAPERVYVIGVDGGGARV